MKTKLFRMIGVFAVLALVSSCATTEERVGALGDHPTTEGGTPVPAEMPGDQGPVATHDPQDEDLTGAATDGERAAVAEERGEEAERVAADEERREATGAAVDPDHQAEEGEAGQAREGRREDVTGAAAAPGAAGQRGAMLEERRKLSRTSALNQLHHINMKEIELAELAKEKSESPEVIRVADRVLADHKKLQERVRSVAEKREIELHSFQQSTHEAAAMDVLRGLEGRAFDQAFLQHMQMSHGAALRDLQMAQTMVNDDAQLVALFRDAIPSIRRHERLSTTGASRMMN